MLVAVLQDFFVSNFGPYEMLGGCLDSLGFGGSEGSIVVKFLAIAANAGCLHGQ